MSIHSSPPGSHSGSSLSVHSIADTITSTAALTAAYRPPPKDFAAAFATLQGQYGMSGDFPARAVVPPKKKQRKSPPSRGASSSNRQPTTSVSTNSTSLDRARSLDSHADRHVLPSSDRVTSTEGTSRATADTGHESALMGGAGGDKGKSSGVSKLKRILGLRFKGTK
ncbi:hypothetical protein B0H13DRAFT_2003099 [Mycena leptocephala]|nr:hypothetical protein B0H13DRAFT_2003099 [Mycena leptocephala]